MSHPHLTFIVAAHLSFVSERRLVPRRAAMLFADADCKQVIATFGNERVRENLIDLAFSDITKFDFMHEKTKTARIC